MTSFRTISLGVLVAALAALPATVISAQETPLSTQEQARLRFRSLHESMQRLQVALSATSPEESKVLEVGNRFVQEARIPERMDEIKQLLIQSRWDEALEGMAEVQEQLHSLMGLLLNRDVDLADLMKEIEKLEQYSKRVDDLIEQQKAEKEAAAKAEALERHIEELKQATQKLEQLAQRQGEVRDQANQAGMSASQADAAGMQASERGLAEDTESLAEQLESLEKEHDELTEKESSETAEDSGEPSAAGGAGSGSCKSAAGSMGKAEQKLGENQPESSLEDMDQALQKLAAAKKALQQLSDEAQRELEKMPLDTQAEAQEQTRVETDDLARDMEKNETAGEKGESPSERAPGTENVQQAVPKQKAAAGQLKEYKPGKAKQEQQDALEDLEKAKQKLEDALAQLRQQLQDEVLRALEERFAAMLATQKELSARTVVTDRLGMESLTADGSLPHALRARCKELSDGELELASEAGDALQLLVEEGTTAVFPEIVEELESDLQAVGQRLGETKTSSVTQAMQSEIEKTLETLIGALRKTIEENSGEAGQCDGEPPLVPMSAELKLILALQERVHKRTERYDTAIPEPARESDEARGEAGEIARKQGRVKELTRKLAVKINKESEAAENK